ncbi:hypothetical protein kac68v162_gp088 [Nodularia phage vB_NspS-kac68v162]|uniref:Uncharacterized protein n=2 Tax=Ravarandavirus kac68v161 TaxID=2845690 RepID=A0A482MKA5_9CAUD|nr:hypothetical protein HWC13_gp090 [Nodularia phage vB_NspS-kac68v161]QBQ73740.1 hypothetical protein kac68v161_gp090 [Nodularia phage vB_NspS-kac68v161]QBQ73936.1 hypothetical protein kac68v162_gp088 [Nodularia phage vB_NspS-kac68v162]
MIKAQRSLLSARLLGFIGCMRLSAGYVLVSSDILPVS